MSERSELQVTPEKAGLRKQVGRRIRQARKRREWSQETLAGRLGVTPAMVRRWERGSSSPSLESLTKLSDVLEVTFDELLRGTPAPLARVPAAQRNELAMSINRLVRAARPLLQAAEETRKRKE